MKLNSKLVELTMAKKKLSLRHMAKAGGITPQGIRTAVRNGSATPATVGKIAAGLGVPVEDIIMTE